MAAKAVCAWMVEAHSYDLGGQKLLTANSQRRVRPVVSPAGAEGRAATVMPASLLRFPGFPLFLRDIQNASRA